MDTLNTNIARQFSVSAIWVLLVFIVPLGCGHDPVKPSADSSSVTRTSQPATKEHVAEQRGSQHTAARPSPVPPSSAGKGNWAKSALLLIDVQRGFWDEALTARNGDFPRNVSELLKTCHSEGIDVIHVRTRFDADASKRLPSFNAIFGDNIPCIEGTNDVQPLGFAGESNGDHVFFKSSFDAFTNEELASYLKERGKTHLFLAGLTTDVCVLSSGLSAVNNGFSATLVVDCCAASHPAAQQFVIARYDGFVFDSVRHSDLISQRSRW